MDHSLSRFFKRAPAASLSNCDREEIHLSGMIQNIAALLVLDPSDHRILGASENVPDVYQIPFDAILGQRLGQIDPEIVAELDAMERNQKIHPEILETQKTIGDDIYDVITHTHQGRRFVEFILNASPSASLARKKMRLCSPACAQIMGADSFDDAVQIAVDTVRELTGFARVKIYKFGPDWSGAVLAESGDGTLPSYLGLNFPDTDIPQQVRELMRIVPYRFIGNSQDDNFRIRTLPSEAGSLDMSWVMSRSVSAMHTAYLRNIGTNASFSCSLLNRGKLWGLIACHHTKETVVPADTWSLANEIGIALMLKLDQQERTQTAEMIRRLRCVENEFASELRKKGDVEDVIKTLVPVLQKFLRADGFAFLYGVNLHTSGETPPPEFIRDLIHWIKANRSGSDQFQTIALHEDYPEAKEHIDSACGILVQPIIVHRVCQLLWFRGPVTRTVHWAGKPTAKLLIDEKTGATLGPRTSFERWIEEHRNQSLPWEEPELEAAREIFKEFLDIIASQLLLKEENSSLRQFAHIAAHDIQAPLRGISNALQWMVEDDYELQSLQEHRDLAEQQALKLQRLTASLLEMSLLSEQKVEFSPYEMNDVIEDACNLMRVDIEASGTKVQVGSFPACVGAPDLITRIFMNLVGNAIKYAKPGTTPLIDISAEPSLDDWVRITVTDNGPGIEKKYSKRIFEVSQRLVTEAEVEGSGFGLAICQRIATLHDGRVFLDETFENGARFVLELPKSPASGTAL
ncbi:ATP-binding protein [Roseobacter weihaiensis]|uniref:ATP-binding protein n=1 Tax=Roseobacter weihaiensis TaxID=2763262 RepID=UPI001D0B6EB1|nr:ATP-binding protein [Roseobacter sp. H9]